MDAITQPFQILKGGYQITFRSGKWSQIFGSDDKARAFSKEDRRGHRSEQRTQEKLLRTERVKRYPAAS
jgi:hypothetical protein